MLRNPLPMGTQAAMGQATPSMQQMAAKAYGSRGGRMSARKRRSKSKAAAPRKRRNGGRKLKFGSPAWRKKYMGKRKRK